MRGKLTIELEVDTGVRSPAEYGLALCSHLTDGNNGVFEVSITGEEWEAPALCEYGSCQRDTVTVFAGRSLCSEHVVQFADLTKARTLLS